MEMGKVASLSPLDLKCRVLTKGKIKRPKPGTKLGSSGRFSLRSSAATLTRKVQRELAISTASQAPPRFRDHRIESFETGFEIEKARRKLHSKRWLQSKRSTGV
eukprot:3289279-Prymnesium_polylepis.1